MYNQFFLYVFKPILPIALATSIATSCHHQGNKAFIPTVTHESPITHVCFTPPAGCQSFIISNINRAERSIYLQGYGSTSVPIYEALEQAANRGVDVNILLDKSNRTAKYSLYKKASASMSKFYIDTITKGISHNKVIIIDDEIILTGSYNWSDNAEHRNAENLLIIKDKDLAAKYKFNWIRLAPID